MQKQMVTAHTHCVGACQHPGACSDFKTDRRLFRQLGSCARIERGPEAASVGGNQRGYVTKYSFPPIVKKNMSKSD